MLENIKKFRVIKENKMKYEAFGGHVAAKGKSIKYIISGSGVAQSGIIVELKPSCLILETKWSNKQYVDLDLISSFWFTDDEPKIE